VYLVPKRFQTGRKLRATFDDFELKFEGRSLVINSESCYGVVEDVLNSEAQNTIIVTQ
jgi:hypothetical protein